jgi:hypothetical protein
LATAHGRISERRTALHDGGHRLGQFFDFWPVKTKLADPDGAQAQAGGVECAHVAGNGVAIDHNPGHIQNAGGHIARQMHALMGDALGVYQQQMVFRTAADDAKAVVGQLLGQIGGIFHNALL